MSSTTFSYAQAAKGRTPAAATDSHIKDDASSVTTAPDASAKTFSTTSEVSESAKSSQIDTDLGSKKPVEDGVSHSLLAPAKNKDDAPSGRDTTAKHDGHANDSSARPSNRSNEPSDARKDRKGKKGTTSGKEGENEQAAAEVEKEKEKAKKTLATLVEGAPPAVNVWLQRAEATKARQPSLPSIITVAEPKNKLSREISTKTSNNAESAEAQCTSTKAGDGPRTIPDSNVRKARSNRAGKSEQTPAPSTAVEDVTSWPTPDIVAAEDGKRKTTVEPESKENKDDGAKASRAKKEWQKIEINPTFNYTTQFSQRGAAKPRGSGQSGRGSGRGHSASLSLPGERASGPANEAPGYKEGAEPQGRTREDMRTAMPPFEKSKKFNADHISQRKQSVASGSRGSGHGDCAPKNESSKTPTANESTAKKDGLHNHSSKPKRGGAHANGRGAHNGHQPFMSNGNTAPRGGAHSSSTYGVPAYQQFGGRGRGPRPGLGSNGYNGPANGLGNRNPHFTQPAGPEFGQFPVFNQASFQPTTGPPGPPHEVLVLDVLMQQAAYYFSEENLRKDDYLKRQMDAQGFVSFDVIAGFNRMRRLSSGDLDAVRVAMLETPSVEFVVGDGRELLRRRGDWKRFVINGSSNAGPTQIRPVPKPKYPSSQNIYYQPQPPQPMAYSQYDPMSPSYGQAYPGREMHLGYMNRHQFFGSSAQINGHIATDNSRLRISAPEFSPVYPGSHGFQDSTFSDYAVKTMKDAETMTDDAIPKLRVVFKDLAHPGLPTFPTVTNGTAELVTGVKASDDHLGSNPATTTEETSPAQADTLSPFSSAVNGDVAHISDKEGSEAYVDLRERALARRKSASGELSRDMQILYHFWTQMLSRNFNLAMYREFRQCAVEDATAPATSTNKYGASCLGRFYANMNICSQRGRPWPRNHAIYFLFTAHRSTLEEIVRASQPTVSGAYGQLV